MTMLSAHGLFGILFISTCVANGMSRDLMSLQRVERSSKRYCGQDINNILQLLCKGEYNTMFKRSKTSVRPNNGFSTFSEERFRDTSKDSLCPNKDTLPIIARSEALATFDRLRGRKKRGVYDECCRKGCTFDELDDYCAI